MVNNHFTSRGLHPRVRRHPPFVQEGDDGILTNLLRQVPEDERYTCIFEGNSQALDHISVSRDVADEARVDVVHVNSISSYGGRAASDHDPVVASVPLP